MTDGSRGLAVAAVILVPLTFLGLLFVFGVLDLSGVFAFAARNGKIVGGDAQSAGHTAGFILGIGLAGFCGTCLLGAVVEAVERRGGNARRAAGPQDIWRRPDSQLRSIEAAQSEWTPQLYATTPADRPATERAVTELYRLHGLVRPRFVWVGSPVTGSLVLGLLSGGANVVPARSLRTALADPEWDVVGHRLRESVRSALAEAYGDGFGIDHPLWNRLIAWQSTEPPWEDGFDQVRREADDAIPWPRMTTPEFLTPFEGHIPGGWVQRIGGPPVGDWLEPVPGLPGWLHQAVDGFLGVDPANACTYDLWRRAGLVRFEEKLSATVDQLVIIARSCGWWWPYPQVCVLAERPSKLVVDGAVPVRPHSSDGPAIEYRDGLVRHAWHGVFVPPEVIAGELTGADWLREENVEIRRAIAERMGYAWLLDQRRAIRIAADEWGTLWRLDDPDDEPIVLVDVLNSTPEPDGSVRRYVLRVPPDQTVPRDAIGWTFGLPPGTYGPDTMT